MTNDAIIMNLESIHFSTDQLVIQFIGHKKICIWLKAYKKFTLKVDFILLFFPPGKFRDEFKAAFSCYCYGQGQNQTKKTRTSTDSRKSLSTQVNNMDNVSRISDQIV